MALACKQGRQVPPPHDEPQSQVRSSHRKQWCCDITSACALTRSTIMAVGSLYISPTSSPRASLPEHRVASHGSQSSPHHARSRRPPPSPHIPRSLASILTQHRHCQHHHYQCHQCLDLPSVPLQITQETIRVRSLKVKQRCLQLALAWKQRRRVPCPHDESQSQVRSFPQQAVEVRRHASLCSDKRHHRRRLSIHPLPRVPQRTMSGEVVLKAPRAIHVPFAWFHMLTANR